MEEEEVGNLEKLRIIAVGAHLDDIEIACGGTLAKAVDNGHIVKMIVLSKSGVTHYDGRIVRTEEEAVAEGRKAASLLSISDLEIYDFPNKDIPYESKVVELLNSRFDEFKPNIIFTHWPFDTHKSHQNTGLSTIAAARYYNSILMFEPFPPGGRSYVAFRPQLYIDITSYIEIKLSALRAHKSQYDRYGEEDWINAVRARAQFRGFDLIDQPSKCKIFAETFEILRLHIEFFI
jgi:LmbE family N-acetylglucosaminyl deacetylase